MFIYVRQISRNQICRAPTEHGGGPLSEYRNSDGTFAQGNRFWEARSSAGPKPKFETPEALLDACLQYFDWVEQNPLFEDRLVTFQGSARHEPVARMRAMTINGLCIFIDITPRQWREWRTERPDLLPVIEQAETIIATQKFEGAAADLLNGNIISRDLGLADRQEHTGKDGAPLPTPEMPMTEVARRLAFVLASGVQEMDEQAPVKPATGPLTIGTYSIAHAETLSDGRERWVVRDDQNRIVASAFGREGAIQKANHLNEA